MTDALPTRWVLVQRDDADPDDRDRVDALADVLGDAATVRRTGGTDDLDAVIAALDGAGLVVCGGDGSIHLAVNRLHAADRLDGTVVALFPAGTGNDLAHTLALPMDPEQMADLLQGGRVRATDLLRLGDHGVAVNAVHAGIGVDAAARSQGLPDSLGAVAYPLGALLAGFGAGGFHGDVLVDGTAVRPTSDTETLMVLVMNGRTIGGGHEFAPEADPTDGQLDVLVCQATSIGERAAFGVAVTRGTHLDRDDVTAARGTSIRVTGPALTYNVDGELWLDPVPDLEITVLPGVLALLCPTA